MDNTNMNERETKKFVWEMEHPEYFFWGAFMLASSLFLFPDTGARAAPKPHLAAASQAVARPYEKISLEAKAAVVFDARTRRFLFERNAHAVLPLASLTKIMTAAVALSLVPEATVIPIGAEALREEGDTGLQLGDEWLLRDLLTLMLLESSNDGAHAVAETAGAAALGSDSPAEGRSFFITQMNRTAEDLSLLSLFFQNETGLDVSEASAGGYGSARDTALLFTRAIAEHPALFEPTRQDRTVLSGNGLGELFARNTNRETGRFPLLLASKTGYTDLAGGNLALAFDAGFNHPIIIVVLGSTYDGRFADAENLLWTTLEYLQRN